MRPSNLIQTLKALLPKKKPIFLWGPPGTGKSAIVRDVTVELDYQMVDVRATLLDPVDWRGIPTVKNGVTQWAPPVFLPREGRGVLFLDELAQAPPLVQASCMQLVLDRAVGEYRLPDEWTVVAASNRQEDRAGTHRLITPLLNRLIHLDVEVSTDDWQEWAVNKGVHPAVRSFINFRPNLLFSFDPSKNERAFATPRSWQFVSDVLGATPPNAVGEVVRGCVGEGPGTEFKRFYDFYLNMPDIDDLLARPATAAIPTEPSLRYALVGALADKIKNDRSKADAAATYAQRLPDEFSMLALRDFIAVDGSLIVKFGKWVAEGRKKGLFQEL